MTALAAVLAAATCIAAPVFADNVKFPAAAMVDAGAGESADSLGGGKSPAPMLAEVPAEVAPPAVDLEAGTVTPGPGSLPARVQEAPLEVAQEAVRAVRSGQGYRYAVAAALAALMVLGLKFAPRIFGKTDRGKAFAVMLLALLATSSTAVAGVAPMSPTLFTAAIGIAFTAVGGRQWISRILWPRDSDKQWLEWLKPWIGVKRDEGPPF
jgi:hypothetical protein